MENNQRMVKVADTIQVLANNPEIVRNLSEKDLESLKHVLNLIRAITVMMIAKEQIKSKSNLAFDAILTAFQENKSNIEALKNRKLLALEKFHQATQETMNITTKKYREVQEKDIPQELKIEAENEIFAREVRFENWSLAATVLKDAYTTEELEEMAKELKQWGILDDKLEQMAEEYRSLDDKESEYRDNYNQTVDLCWKDGKDLVAALLNDPYFEKGIEANYQYLIDLCARSLCDKDKNILGELFTRVDNGTSFKGCVPDPEKINAFLSVIRNEQVTDELIKYMDVLEAYETDKKEEKRIDRST